MGAQFYSFVVPESNFTFSGDLLAGPWGVNIVAGKQRCFLFLPCFFLFVSLLFSSFFKNFFLFSSFSLLQDVSTYSSATNNILSVCFPVSPQPTTLLSPISETVITSNGFANFTWGPADFSLDPNCNAGISGMGNTRPSFYHFDTLANNPLFFLLFLVALGYQLFIQSIPDFSSASPVYQGSNVSCTVAVGNGISYWMVMAYKVIDGITYSSTSNTGIFALVSLLCFHPH